MDDLTVLYSPSYWSKRLSSPKEVENYHLEFVNQASATTRNEIPCQLDVAYGSSDRQKLDIFGTDLRDDAPILMFFHGGYWQTKELSRASYHFIAKTLHQHNIKTIFVGYDLCPDVTIPQIVHQVGQSARKCLEYAKEKRSRGVYFMGHSAGAHLVASLFTASICEEDKSIVKGAILASGLFDLSPLQKTAINEPLKLDEEVAEEMSPLKRGLFNGTAFYLIVGANESPEFVRQSKEFATKLRDLGFQADFSLIENVDHFDLIEKLAEEEYELVSRLVKIMK
jgi:arylformamidase